MKFTSKYKEHRLVIVPTYKQIVGMTQQLVTGKSIQFMNNEFETENQEEIDFLRNHREFNINIFEVPSQESIDEEMVARAEEILAKKAAKDAEKAKIEAGSVEVKKEVVVPTTETEAVTDQSETSDDLGGDETTEDLTSEETFPCLVAGCGFVAKSKLGLMSHMRSHK